jgi:metallo-beta-lactamase class B
MHLKLCAVLAVVLSGCASAPVSQMSHVSHQPCAANANWDDPSAPRQIFANTWFVGTCGVTSILITSAQGHVLIDGGTEKGALLIEQNIRALGFRVEDVRYLVSSHEHYDHIGGLARLQRDSGGTVVARTVAAEVLERGQSDRRDPQLLELEPFQAVRNVQRIADGGILQLGDIVLTAHATPGHTPGSTSWTWSSCTPEICRQMVYADSLTALTDDVYRYSDESQNPGVVQAFRDSLAKIAALPCDILLTPHPSASKLWSRLGPGASEPLVEPSACQQYAAIAATRLEARIAKEKEAHAQD